MSIGMGAHFQIDAILEDHEVPSGLQNWEVDDFDGEIFYGTGVAAVMTDYVPEGDSEQVCFALLELAFDDESFAGITESMFVPTTHEGPNVCDLGLNLVPAILGRLVSPDHSTNIVIFGVHINSKYRYAIDGKVGFVMEVLDDGEKYCVFAIDLSGCVVNLDQMSDSVGMPNITDPPSVIFDSICDFGERLKTQASTPYST